MKSLAREGEKKSHIKSLAVYDQPNEGFWSITVVCHYHPIIHHEWWSKATSWCTPQCGSGDANRCTFLKLGRAKLKLIVKCRAPRPNWFFYFTRKGSLTFFFFCWKFFNFQWHFDNYILRLDFDLGLSIWQRQNCRTIRGSKANIFMWHFHTPNF